MTRSRRGVIIPPHLFLTLLFVFSSVLGAQERAAAEEGPRAARDLARGQEITRDDIAAAQTTSESDLPLGWVTRRVIREGEFLRPPAIARPSILAANTTVTVRAPAGRVTVTRQGTALANAGVGDTVLVRLDRSSSVSAIVIDSTTVVLIKESR